MEETQANIARLLIMFRFPIRLFEFKTPWSFKNRAGCVKCFYERKFLEEATRIHVGRNYDYSKIDYKNTNTPVMVVCPEHGEFKVVPWRHLHNGTRCPLCPPKDWYKDYIEMQNALCPQTIHDDKKTDYPETIKLKQTLKTEPRRWNE